MFTLDQFVRQSVSRPAAFSNGVNFIILAAFVYGPVAAIDSNEKITFIWPPLRWQESSNYCQLCYFSVQCESGGIYVLCTNRLMYIHVCIVSK